MNTNAQKNWREVIYLYDWYFKSLELYNSIEHIDPVLNLSEVLNKKGIADLCHRARFEIRDLTEQQNNNAELFKKNAKEDILELTDKADFLINHYKLNHADRMPKYICYFKSVQPLFDLLDWFNKKISSTVNHSQMDNGIDIDLSKTKATEKIIYLKELGVLDFLRTKQPFISSINSLATILSAITGEQNTTLQPYLNAIYGNGVDTTKDPYSSTKTVTKVKSLLGQVGFTLK